jgi:anti-sigma B factor antagonist
MVGAVLFDVQVLERAGWSVVSVVGDVDLASLPELRQQAESASGDRVLLDLSGVDHLDPLGFGIVHAMHLRAARRGARFAVVCPPGRPRELFTETGVDRLIEVADGAEALSQA